MRLLICYGTRPEWIKIKPVISKLTGEIKYRTLFTGQHEDIAKGNFDHRLSIKDGNNRLDAIFNSVLSQVDPFFEDITHVLVQGDTATAAAIALSAFHHKIPVIHLEAGLRTYDLEQPYPEEAYRQIIGTVASIHFCPTWGSYVNLQNEKKGGKKFMVGNTVLDNLVDLKPTYGDYAVVTMHRRENHAIMDQWFERINYLCKKTGLEFILPIHPNPNVQKHKDLLTYVTVIDPLPYEEMKELLAGCKFVITDSGGIQEEASFLFKKTLVCRQQTERGESLTRTSCLCPTPRSLVNCYHQEIEGDEFFGNKNPYFIAEKINEECPYGDGKASDRILSVLKGLENEPRREN